MPGRDARKAAGHHGFHRGEGATVAPAQSRGASGVSGDLTVCLVGERSEPGRSGPVLAAVWMEDERVGLGPGGNIPPRCGLAPSSEKWRTERTQLGSVPLARLRSSSTFRSISPRVRGARSRPAELAHGRISRRVRPTGLTLPQAFSDYAAFFAGRLAGLEAMRVLSEPAAAANAYAVDEHLREEGNVVVLHVGGGTAEASVLTLVDGA